jgi:hypothetical protein
MANRKTKKRSSWTPPRTVSSGQASARAAGGTGEAGAATSERPAGPDGPRQPAGVDNSRQATAASNRAARKEEARRQREALRKRAARRKTTRLVGIVVAIVAVIAGIAIVVASRGGGGTTAATPSNPSTLPGVFQTGPPWQPELTQLKARVDQMKLPLLTASNPVVVHNHMHIQIFVDGNPVSVPANIGISPDQTFDAPLHTHDASGVIHWESPVPKTYTLGDFFDVWGLYFTDRCIGNLCNSGAKTLKVFVNGRAVSDPVNLVFRQHQEIVVTYGTPQELPSPIPSTYPSTDP